MHQHRQFLYYLYTHVDDMGHSRLLAIFFLVSLPCQKLGGHKGPLKVGSTQIAIICVEGRLIALLHSRAELAEESCLVGRRILLC